VIKDFDWVLYFSHHETIVEIEILKLGNNSYSILWGFPKLTIFNLFLEKNIILGFEILMVKYMVYISKIIEY
jgi:hypothetical protein